MPKEVQNAKEFSQYLETAAVPEDSEKARPKNSFQNKLTIKHNRNGVTKFKLRTSRYLITLKTQDKRTVKKIMDTLPPSLNKVVLNSKRIKKRRR